MFERCLSITTAALCCTLFLACDKADAGAKAGDDKADDAAKTDAKEPAAKQGDEPAPEAEPAVEKPKAPAMEPLAIEAWGVTMRAPAGSKLGEVEDGGGDMADTVSIDAEAGCDVEIELYRHKKTDTIVAEMFKNTTGPSGNKNDQYPLKEESEAGYKVKKSWDIPLGTMWAAEVGTVVGDHLIMCGAGDLMGVEEAQADCALQACQSITAAGG